MDHGFKETCDIKSTQVTYETDHISIKFCFLYNYLKGAEAACAKIANEMKTFSRLKEMSNFKVL